MKRSALASVWVSLACSFVVSALLVATATPALAAAQRTFVHSSPLGNDANTAVNCSLVAPCRSFNAAISVTSPGGEVVILDTAGYGAMTINKSLKVIGPSGVYGGISVLGGANPTVGVVINAGDTDVVTLRGLDISGVPGLAGPFPNIGIDIQNAGTVHIEKSSISNFTQDTSACIRAVSAKEQLIFVSDSFLRECRNGILLNGTGPDDTSTIVAKVDNTRIEHGSNTTGIGTTGIRLQGFAASLVRNSVILLHDIGIRMDNLPTNGSSNLMLAQSQVIGTGTGLSVVNTSSGAYPEVTVIGSQFYGSDDGIVFSNTGPGSAIAGSLKIADSHFENMWVGGITASTGADAVLWIEIVRSQVTRIGNTAVSLAASGTSRLGLDLRESTLSNAASTLLKTSGASSNPILVSLIRSHLHNSFTAVDHGQGRIRMEQTNVSANLKSLVNHGSNNIVSAGTNWIVDNIDASDGTVYITTPGIIAPK